MERELKRYEGLYRNLVSDYFNLLDEKKMSIVSIKNSPVHDPLFMTQVRGSLNNSMEQK
jgi:hypothetical protein